MCDSFSVLLPGRIIMCIIYIVFNKARKLLLQNFYVLYARSTCLLSTDTMMFELVFINISILVSIQWGVKLNLYSFITNLY